MLAGNAHHFVAPTDEDSHGASVRTVLDDHHLIPRGSKRDFPDNSRLSELLWGQVLESRDNATLGGNGNQLGIRVARISCYSKADTTTCLDLWTADPSDGWEVILH